MFELSIAWKYLLPKRRQLSVAIISLISILVISLVVWLILIFFSVTKGLEKGWIEKLISISAPLRLSPKDAYYSSYYFQIDPISQASDYSFRSIGEKKVSPKSDPYDPETDEELPSDFPQADRNSKGELKDPVKLAYQILNTIPGITVADYEVTHATMRLRLLRGSEPIQTFLTQAVYLGTFESHNPSYGKTFLPPSENDLQNTSKMFSNSKSLGILEKFPYYVFAKGSKATDEKLPFEETAGYGVVVPKGYKDAGVLLGDRGEISYLALTASAVQEQRIPIFIAGFYDPGIVPLGGKFLLADSALVRTVRSSQQQDTAPMTNGIHVRFENFSKAKEIKNYLEKEFQKWGIDAYWKVETFREYDYAKDLLQQLSSEKNIFGLIAGVIIVVACSNIVSMLVILVNNKRSEIGILRSMGAKAISIASIFALAGFAMGAIGSLIGSILAFFTLKHLDKLLHLISRLQGYEAFNPIFYGEHLPNQMNGETLFTVIIATALISLIAGVIPAIKACKMQPSHILRSE